MKVKNKYGKKEWTLVTIESNECWCCGTIGVTTNHHAIPQRFEPKMNTIVPVCPECHNKINKQDVHGLIGFMFKTGKQMQQIAHSMRELVRRDKKK